ncbi:unnamed protein product [Closterium sp. NIES-53]
MVADSSDNNVKSNGGAGKKERTAGQFFHIGEQGEQGDASAKVAVELHPLDYWVLDMGASWTMTLRKKLLDDVAGAGRAAFKGADDNPVVLHDVLLVPDLKANLISLRKLAKAGVSTSTDGARTQIWGDRLGNGTPTLLACGTPLLKQLEEDGAVKGLKLNGQPPDDNFEICLLSKITRFPFHTVAGRSKKPLELVHMDLSRLIWAYPLKQKNHAALTIQEDRLPFVEKQAECVVKLIRTDRGGEFLGAEMTAWLKKQGIQRELTTAYTPQSNGVAERANRTILETARALLIESGVGNSMWPHAVWQANVARNRVLTKVGNESWVPLERWLGRKPLVDMLRVLGWMAVAHVPKKYRNKLGASAIWCVHLGLAAESKGWLLWEPSKNVLFDSRDVRFVECMMYGGWKKQPETKVS